MVIGSAASSRSFGRESEEERSDGSHEEGTLRLDPFHGSVGRVEVDAVEGETGEGGSNVSIVAKACRE